MPERRVTRFFGMTKGIDRGNNALTRPLDALIEARNVMLSSSGNIIPRPGHRVSTAAPSHVGVPVIPNCGIHTYQYFDKDEGATKEELIGVAAGDDAPSALLRLEKGRVTISNATSAFRILMIPKTDGTAWEIDLLDDTGSSLWGSPVAVAGAGSNSVTRLSQIRNLINAESAYGMQCLLTPCAVVDGVQANRDSNNPVAVHTTFSATTQPLAVINSSPPYKRYAIPSYNHATTTFQWVDVITPNAGTITTHVHLCLDGLATQSFADLEEIGIGGLAAIGLGYFDSGVIAAGEDFVIDFDYWAHIRINEFVNVRPFEIDWRSPHKKGNYSFSNAANCCFISSDKPLGEDTHNESRKEVGLFKYDGQQIYQAGLPQAKLVSIGTDGAGPLTGRYRYLYRHKVIDRQGNFTFSNDSLLVSPTNEINYSSHKGLVTLTGITNQSSTCPLLFPRVGRGQFDMGGGGPFTIDNTSWVKILRGHTLKIGDSACWGDPATGVVSERYLVSGLRKLDATDDEIRFDIPAGKTVDIKGGEIVTNSITVEVYRTKAGGNVYYMLGEYVMTGSATFNIPDEITDANLGVQYEGTSVGTLRRDMPPPLSIITTHEGLIVGSGRRSTKDNGNVNEIVYFSTQDSPEYFPSGTNFFYCRGSKSGPITALLSADVNNLIVFKSNSYFDVTGSLSGIAFALSERTEGNLGCVGPNAVTRIGEKIMFLSDKGPRFIQQGTIIKEPQRLATFFDGIRYSPIDDSTPVDRVTCPYLPLTNVAVDQENQLCLIFIPAIDDNKIWRQRHLFAYDYSEGGDAYYTWVNDSDAPNYSALMNGVGGVAFYGDRLYLCDRMAWGAPATSPPFSSTDVRRGIVWKESRYGNSPYKYGDDCSAFRQRIRAQWDHGDNARLDKEYKDLALFVLPEADGDSFEEELLLPSVLTVRAYKNFGNGKLLESHIVTESAGAIDVPFAINKGTAISVEVETALRDYGGDGYGMLLLSGYQYITLFPFTAERRSTQ